MLLVLLVLAVLVRVPFSSFVLGEGGRRAVEPTAMVSSACSLSAETMLTLRIARQVDVGTLHVAATLARPERVAA
ncbi:hypothetical protein [Frankia sp. R82]|uniref:hypothetical protein n=1 Tax=Frankia sp. R82 TaxID=2950553 RepID=UPI002043AE03|nr:hypothetical protein [Frankia sp. R82]MCM3886214.1 hypothetical protein [Frankia sp. R82]